MQGILRDISSREAAEAQLRQREEQLRLIFENSLDAVVTMTAEGTISGWNPRAEAIFGWEIKEVLGRRMSEVIIPERYRQPHEEGLKRYIQGGDSQVLNKRIELTALHKNGREFSVELTLTSVGTTERMSFAAFIRDLSELKRVQEAQARLEGQLRQAQKMEAIGTLAGGIAHDFNNILAAIIAFADIARIDSVGNRGVQESLEQVLKAGDRARELVQQILTFSRHQKQERKPARLQPVAKEVLRLIRSTLPSTIEIVSDVRLDAGRVLADTTQIHQILVNLCTNAAHAMKQTTGRLELRLEPLTVNEPTPLMPELRVGNYVRLTVADSGHGMDESTLKRIFDPFFTTKAAGEGTGLGLAVVHGIVHEHDGTIQVTSEVGKGTAFHIYFPLCEDQTGDVVAPTIEIPKGDGERVLVVDDEAALCLAAGKILQKLNYKVTTQSSSKAAMALAQENPDAFDLILTDLTMPGLTGVDLAAAVQKIRPGFPLVMMTGYSGTWTPENVRSLGIHQLIAKPMAPAMLAQAIRKALDASVSAASAKATPVP